MLPKSSILNTCCVLIDCLYRPFVGRCADQLGHHSIVLLMPVAGLMPDTGRDPAGKPFVLFIITSHA